MKDKIQEDIKTAMKSGDTLRRDTLRCLVSEVKKTEIDSQKQLDEAGIIAIIQKEVKKRRDALEFAEKAGRDELIEKNKSEITILQSYLGEQLGEDKLRELIQQLVAGGANNVGAVMGALNKDYKGKFEGKVASQLAKEILG